MAQSTLVWCSCSDSNISRLMVTDTCMELFISSGVSLYNTLMLFSHYWLARPHGSNSLYVCVFALCSSAFNHILHYVLQSLVQWEPYRGIEWFVKILESLLLGTYSIYTCYIIYQLLCYAITSLSDCVLSHTTHFYSSSLCSASLSLHRCKLSHLLLTLITCALYTLARSY